LFRNKTFSYFQKFQLQTSRLILPQLNMQKSMIFVLFGILAIAYVASAQREEIDDVEDVHGDDNDVAASNIASSLGIDGQVLYEDLVRIRDEVVPLAEQYSNQHEQ